MTAVAPARPVGAPERFVLQLRRWIGHVMGVDPEFLHDRPRRGLRDMYHFLLISPPPDANSAVLAGMRELGRRPALPWYPAAAAEAAR